MEPVKAYFKNLTPTDRLIWACAGILLLKWLFGDASVSSGIGAPRLTGFGSASYGAVQVDKGGVAFWGVVLYSIAVLSIRMGWVKQFVAENKALLVLFCTYGFFLTSLGIFIELRGSQIQFILSGAVIGIQLIAYKRLVKESRND
jgi:hypothetical protein